MLSFEQCFILFSSFPLLLAFVVGGPGFEFCVFVAGWRHALRSEWPFIIIIIIKLLALSRSSEFNEGPRVLYTPEAAADLTCVCLTFPSLSGGLDAV